MKGIPSSLIGALRHVILDCCPLEEPHLRAWFKDERLALWEQDLPGFEGLDRLARAEMLIDFLAKRKNWHEEYGLVIFLRVLRDETELGEACYKRLDRMVNQINDFLNKPESPEELPEEMNLLLSHIKVTLWKGEKGWLIKVQNISDRTLKRVTLFLHPGQALWLNKHRLSCGTLPPAAYSTAIPVTISIEQPSGLIDKKIYQLKFEAVYQIESGKQAIRLQKWLEILV